MKPIVGGVIGFVIGTACGGIGAYFLMKNKFAQEAQKEINEYRDIARKRIQQADEYVNSKLDKEDAEEYNLRCDTDPDFVDYTLFYDENIKKAQKAAIEATSNATHDPDFDKHMAERENPEEDEEEDEDSYEQAVSEARVKSMEDAKTAGQKPFYIDEAEFYNTNQWYDKISITWYMGDDFVCDDRDEIMTEDEIEDSLGGYDWKQWFDKDSDDPDICHVRNSVRGTDYEICRTPERYSDAYSPETNPDSDEPVIHIS